MKRIPGTREVDRAIVALGAQLKSSLKLLNQQAAKMLAKGDYSSAQAMVGQARSIQGFQTEVRNLRESWRAVKSSTSKGSSVETTPRWEYYKPILRALIALGGTANRDELESAAERELKGILKAGDTILDSRGVPRWKKEIRRARKTMVEQSFLKDVRGEWIITKQGERAANSDDNS